MAPRLPGDVGVGPFGLLCVAMHNGFEDLDLDRLRRRRSEKWRLHPPDVLPAFIAEMDYDLAEPVLAALRAAVDLSDCGYPALGGIGETFAAFAAARHGWTVDPGRVFSPADLGRIGELAERYGVLVLADEIHASLTLPGARHTPFVSLGGAAAEHGITLASASKAFNVAGLKGAVAVAGSAVMER